jgi:hypothetical protein
MGLDIIELLISWEETFQISIPDADVMMLETPQVAIDYICARLDAMEGSSSCPTLHAFHYLRRSICGITGAIRREVRPSVSIRHFYRYLPPHEFWDRLKSRLGTAKVRSPRWFSQTTVRDILEQLLMAPPPLGERWTRHRVCTAVRASVRQYVSRRFCDDEHFDGDRHDAGKRVFDVVCAARVKSKWFVLNKHFCD